MNDKCFNCNTTGTDFFGFKICASCKKKLRLFTDKTVAEHIRKFTKSGYQKDVQEKLALLESDYIKKKIKLLDILQKIEM